MQATKMKPEAGQAAPPAAEQAACCAMPAKQARARPWLIGGALIVLSLALYAGWDWLAAAGIASVLVAAAPCLVMCALGLCAARAGGAKGPAESASRQATPTRPESARD